MAKQSKEEREAFLAQIKADFDERLARIASDPQQWVTFIEQVAVFRALADRLSAPLELDTP